MTTLYETDFNQWIEETAKTLKEGNFHALDLENLIEEIESMGSNNKREIKSRLIVLLMHLLKCKYQPEKQTRSWIATINTQRTEIELVLEDSPSLRSLLTASIANCYKKARLNAATETNLSPSVFPLECPFTQEQILDSDYFPNA
ncbi:MAG: DUF29 family protein [Cyanobacteria bacterium RI_101]|nr:DUF29 family protein [Cyanobacteria bacterium RI_101]